MPEKGYIRVMDKFGRTLAVTQDWQITTDAVDYVIFKDGNIIKAKNGNSGVIEFSGNEISDVITDILNTTNGKVRIFIKAGRYEVTKSIVIVQDGVEIFGVKGATILQGNGIGSIFTSQDESGYIHNPGRLMLHDLYIKDAQAYYGSTYYSQFYNLVIESSNTPGITLTDTDHPTGNCVDNWIYNNFIKAFIGIRLVSAGTDNIVYGNIIFCANGGHGIEVDNAYGQQIIGNHIYTVKNSYYGIVISRSKQIVIAENKIETCEAWSYGIGISSRLGVVSEHINVIGNQIQGASTSGVRGIFIYDQDGSGNPDNVVIVGNLFRGAFQWGIQAPTGAINIEISGNVFNGSYSSGYTNYLKKNYGTATFSGDGTTTQFTIVHGLVSTPSYVNVIPKAGAPQPDSIDADTTNITLTFTTAPAAGTYYYWWEARV